jgi:hypothetical protein
MPAQWMALVAGGPRRANRGGIDDFKKTKSKGETS